MDLYTTKSSIQSWPNTSPTCFNSLLWLQTQPNFWQLYLAAFVESSTPVNVPTRSYRSEELVVGLTELAHAFSRLKLTEIQVAGIQPTWLLTSEQQRLYRLWVSLWGGSCFGLLVGLIGGLSFGLAADMWQGLSNGFIGGIFGGFISGFTVGLISLSIEDLSLGPLGTFNEIRPLPIFRMSLHNFYWAVQRKLFRLLIMTILLGGFLGLGRQPLNLLLFALLSAVIFGMLENFFLSGVTQNPQKVGRTSRRTPAAMVYGLAALCGIGLCTLLLLVFNQPVPWPNILLIGPPVALYFWFFSSGIIYLQRLIMRQVLWRSGTLPWNLTKFLNEATSLGFLQEHGASYRFSHPILQDCFATAYLLGASNI